MLENGLKVGQINICICMCMFMYMLTLLGTSNMYQSYMPAMLYLPVSIVPKCLFVST